MFQNSQNKNSKSKASRALLVSVGTLVPAMILSFQNCGKVAVSEIAQPMLAPSPAKLCDPALSPKPCARNNGTGFQYCNFDGESFGSCLLDSCDQNYNLFRGECDFTGCTPGTMAACSGTNGFGTHTCQASGLTYSDCSLNSCVNGYFLNSSKSPQTCDQWVCIPSQFYTCTIANGTARQQCNTTGSALGACTLTACATLYHQVGNACVLDVPCMDQVTNQRVALGQTGTYAITSSPGFCSYFGQDIGVACVLSQATCTVNGWGSPYPAAVTDGFTHTCGTGEIGADYYPACPR